MKKIFSLIIALSLIISIIPVSAEEDYSVLNKNRGIHPKLYISEYETLKNNIKNDNKMKKLFDVFIESTDQYILNEPLKYYIDPSSEDGWMRDVGDRIADMVFAYKMTEDKKYFEAAKNWSFNAIKNYPSWGRGNAENKDLATSHMIVGISLLYDWCFSELKDSEKELIIEKFKVCGKSIPTAWYKGSYLQNHLWHAANAMMLMGIATYDELPEAKEYINWANDRFKNVFYYLDDGATHEGLQYWNYGIKPLITYTIHAKKYCGIDYFNHPYLQKGWEYVLYETLPFDDYEKGIESFNFGDSVSKGIAQKTLGFMSFFSKITGNKTAQYMASKFADYCLSSNHNIGWYSFTFYNYNMEEESPKDAKIPLFKDFSDLHYIYMRSSWDSDASALATRCGPVLGMKGATTTYPYNLGTGHTHSDVGHISLWAKGEWILPDDGYVKNSTAQHNTLLINNEGQRGNFGVWTKEDVSAIPTVLYEIDNKDYSYVVLECKESYKKESGLFKFNRHIIFLKSGAVVLVDDIKTEGIKDLELRFHPKGQTSFKQSDNNYIFIGDNIKYAIKPVPLKGAKDSYEETEQFASKTGAKTKKNALIIRNKTNRWVQPTIITWGNKNDRTKTSDAIKKSDDSYKFIIGNETIDLNIRENKINFKKNSNGINVKYKGNIIEFTDSPIMVNNRILVPFTKFFETMNLEADFDGNTGEIYFKNKEKDIRMKLLSDKITVNGEEKKNDSFPLMHNSSLYIPLRPVCEGLGLNVIYDSASLICSIKKDINFDTKLLGVFVNSKSATRIDDKNFETTYLGSKIPEITVVPSSSETIINITNSKEKYGKKTIIIKSPDGKEKEEYVLNIKETKGFGDIVISDVLSSGDDGNVCENTVDRDLSTRWSANGADQWILYDLGEEKDISKIGIAFSQGSRRKAFLDIQVSDDGENFRTVKNVVSSGTTDEIEYYVFENKIKTRYVKFLGKGNSSNKWNSITETAFF